MQLSSEQLSQPVLNVSPPYSTAMQCRLTPHFSNNAAISLVSNGVYKELLKSPPRTFLDMTEDELQELLHTKNKLTGKLFQEAMANQHYQKEDERKQQAKRRRGSGSGSGSGPHPPSGSSISGKRSKALPMKYIAQVFAHILNRGPGEEAVKWEDVDEKEASFLLYLRVRVHKQG
jgi:hypothetical protein